MITARVDMTQFNRGIAGLIRATKLNGRVVVEKEVGEMSKTLVRVTPPKVPAVTRKNIQEGITAQFDAVRNESIYGKHKEGKSGVVWYAWDKKYLFGAAPQDDKRKASVEELMELRHTIRGKHHRRVVDFRHKRKNQRVAFRQQILTKESTIKRLIARVQRHVGRLKAGWYVAVWAGAVRVTQNNAPPQWVSRHREGARGSYISRLANPQFPQFEIANFAQGATQKFADHFVGLAVKARAKAMATNARMYLKGKKRISDYAKN